MERCGSSWSSPERILFRDAGLLEDVSQTISIDDLGHRLERDPTLQLVDVRSPGEYAAGHVPRALNVPLEQLEARLQDLSSGPIAVLCQSGTRAGMACDRLALHRHGLLLVEGGTDAWVAAGRPLVASNMSRWSLERQVRLIAGLLVLTGTIGAIFVPGMVYLAMFIGAGLTFAGLTNLCGMAFLLARLPWNRPKIGDGPRAAEVRS
jgi:rhodanese-related sulfurtransferase